jgi:hypothetical protein
LKEKNMKTRKARQGGQAIVMVTLALMSMTGMLGLAVDLGWAYFTQKSAQAAADDGALSAVQRAYRSIVTAPGANSVTVFNSCGTSGVTCAANQVTCTPGGGLGNLDSACLYAMNDGFTPGGHNGHQNVTVQANIPPALPDSIPDFATRSPKDMIYWVTVRTNENIPQLFSAVLGHANATVSAVATAAIASKVVPGSFYGMNHQGDCFTTTLSGTLYCGVDFVGAGGTVACPSGPAAFLCAPAGAFLASTCHGTAVAGCTGNGNYAGSGSLNGGPGIDIPIANALDPSGTWTPTPTVNSSISYQDPTQNEQQPPLAASSPIPSCGLNGPVANNTVLGPFQYYHYTVLKNGLPDPDGGQISLGSGNSITFANNGTCPGVLSSSGTSQSSSAFPLYVFYGGLTMTTQSNGGNGASATFGAGQYVMAGVKGSGNIVFNADKADLFTTGATPTSYSGSGNMFIATDQHYPGLSSQLSTVPNNTDGIPLLQFGSTYLKGGNGNTASDLYGIVDNVTSGTTNLPPSLNAYSGILFWQDRANSTVTYDVNGNVTSQTNPNCPASSCTSPELLLDHGHNNFENLHGVFYQPRGAWTLLEHGSANIANSPLQLMTGAIVGASGNDSAQLTSPTNQLVRYLPVLIQ